MSTVNGLLKNCSKVWLDIRTIPDLQEPDKQVPFLHLSLLRIPFISPLCPSIPRPAPRQSPFSTAMETACGKPWLFWENCAF